MTPINIQTIQDKLFKLDKNIDFIEDILKDGKENLLKDEARYYGLEHILQISVQNILDIGAHILAESFKENPASYGEVIELLGKRGVISADFASEQIEMAKFRNFIIHEYDSVNKDKVLEYAKSAPVIFKTFGRAFRSFLEKNS
jgi:uncharacterized protein YutE (UPF0331/DUF86 family)